MDKNEVVKEKKKSTRETLIEVAQDLFGRFGINKTSINDIAEAAKKGRRTVYTYFKNKEELLRAIVEQELNILFVKLQKVRTSSLTPHQKIIFLIYTHVETIFEIVMRNGSLKAAFFNDISQVERIRYKFDKKEKLIIARILREGVENGDFVITDIDTTAMLLQYSIKGLEVPFINQQTHKGQKSNTFDKMRAATEEILFYGLRYNNENQKTKNKVSNETINE